MIKCDGSSIEINGNGLSILAELGLLVMGISDALLEDFPHDEVRKFINMSVEKGIAISMENKNDLSEEEKRALEVQEIIRRLVGK